jgi:hypothetical protein
MIIYELSLKLYPFEEGQGDVGLSPQTHSVGNQGDVSLYLRPICLKGMSGYIQILFINGMLYINFAV